MKKAKNFQIAEVQPQGVAKLLLDFLPFQPGVTYKSAAYKKKHELTESPSSLKTN